MLKQVFCLNTFPHRLFLFSLMLAMAAALLPTHVPLVRAASSASTPVPISLTSYLNNKGIGSAAGQANFDGSNYGYPADQLPSGGSVTINKVPYNFPTVSTGNDNVVTTGQTISMPSGSFFQASLLAASSYGPTSGTATVTYTDGSTSTVTLTVPDWYSGTDGVITSSYRYSPTGTDSHTVSVFAVELSMDYTKVPSSITLPTTPLPAANQASIHIFAMTLQSVTQGYAVSVINAHTTTRMLTGTSSTQVIQATIENVGTSWFTSANPATATVQATGVQTVTPAVVSALGVGELALVEIGITSPSLTAGTKETGTVSVTVQGGNTDTLTFSLTAGVPSYSATDASLTQHQSPDWYNNAKFGIFIHWGVYSVPAWAPTNSSGASTEYAEWYWHNMNNSSDPTYQHHLQTYGQNFNYDDFIPQFTAANFNPQAWVQLFQQAGAKYFVLVSKHHDGFSLFKTQYSHRDAVDLGPHKDLVQALFAAAAKYTPDIKRGLYYSLPEWYNPSYPGDPADGNFPGGSPHNPYTGASITYTGYTAVSSYVQNFQKPQMLELVNNYHPDILWCDIGGPNDSNTVFASYFNQGLTSGQQVAVDNRCGNSAHDFTTPEYSSYSNLTTSKWESNRGIDPFSYGYNSATAASAYATADQLITNLVDIVSKNGNLLLDIGPKADGTVPAIMQQRLQDIGAWLKVNGESIYNTTYWWRTPQDGNLRFTISPNKAFYITSLVQPGSQIVVNQPVPIQSKDQITMLGYNGGPLQWTQSGGKLTINVPTAAQQAGQHAWVFKVNWA